MLTFPENFKTVQAIPPQVGTGAAITSDTISLKYAQKVFLVVEITDVGGNALLLTPQRDVTVAAAASVALVNNVKIWSNVSTGVSDLLVRVADALNFTTAATAVNKQIVFEINPDSLGLTAGGVQYDCVNLLTGAVNANTTISATWIVQGRYAPTPSVIVD
jgi:hypothetical protein